MGVSSTKRILFGCDYVISVSAIGLIAFGAILLAHEDKGIGSVTDVSFGGFAIAVGVIAILFAFLGIYAAVKENSRLLLTYAITLIVVLILQLVLGALALVEIDDDVHLRKATRQATQNLFNNILSNPNDDKPSDTINTMQSDWECCGVDGPSTWGFLDGVLKAPASCYRNKVPLPENLYGVGCARTYQDKITTCITEIGCMAVGFAVIYPIAAVYSFKVRNQFET